MDGSTNARATGGKNVLIWIGIVLVILGIVYAVLRSHQPTDNNPNACVNQTFQVGDKGSCVSDGQNLLNWYAYGIDGPNYMKVNGIFTASMQAVVQKTQVGASLTGSGQLNPATWKLLCQSDDTPSWWKTAAKNAGCP